MRRVLRSGGLISYRLITQLIGGLVGRKKTIEDDHDNLAYCLTLLLETLCPSIDKAETYSLMYEFLDQGIDEKTSRTYGAMVRATAYEGSKLEH